MAQIECNVVFIAKSVGDQFPFFAVGADLCDPAAGCQLASSVPTSMPAAISVARGRPLTCANMFWPRLWRLAALVTSTAAATGARPELRRHVQAAAPPGRLCS